MWPWIQYPSMFDFSFCRKDALPESKCGNRTFLHTIQVVKEKLIKLVLQHSEFLVLSSVKFLTHIRPILHSYRNQSIDWHCKSIDWFLYECNISLIWFKKLTSATFSRFANISLPPNLFR